eukprot:TRINITY_DN8201_c0_g1_i4.p1 TRINITY_DN8201_c0_g1~~TRINITY_DN8201_c0_g1_i4.p1  ORF type:complete len:630 (+),score=64.38 TRINITY_DN8201_c0_g1_i4:49-1890(+)
MCIRDSSGTAPLPLTTNDEPGETVEKRSQEDRREFRLPVNDEDNDEHPEAQFTKSKSGLLYFISDDTKRQHTKLHGPRSFSTPAFLEFLFYHLIYMHALGPLLLIVALFSKRVHCIVSNLSFCRLNEPTVFQNLFFFLNTAFIIAYYFLGTSGITLGDIIMLNITTLQSTMINSLRYGTFSEEQLDLLRHKVLTMHEINREQMTVDWSNQTPEIIENEVSAALRNHQVEPALFYMRFSRSVDITTRINEKQMTRRSLFRFQSSSNKHGALETAAEDTPVYGGEIIKYYVQEFKRINRKNQITLKRLGFAALSLFRAFLPNLIRCACLYNFDFRYILGKDLLSQIPLGIQLVMSIRVLKGKFNFYFSTNADTERVRFLLEQHIALVMANRSRKDALLPPLNLACPLSLRTWGVMRAILMDYGQKFLYRQQLYQSWFFMLCVGSMVVSLLFVMNTIDGQREPVLVYCLIFDTVILIIKLLREFSIRATINENFNLQKHATQTIKLVHMNLKELTGFYFSNADSDASIENPLYAEVVKAVKRQLDRDSEDEEAFNSNLRTYSKKSVSVLTKILDDLKYQEANHKMSIAGVEATYERLIQMLSIIASVGFGAASRFV